MTTFGKVLVFVNLVGGIALLTWGATAYANRVDWVDRKTDTETVEGEITRLRKEIDRTTKSIADAQAAYATRAAILTKTENDRDTFKQKLDQRINEARAGTFRVQNTYPNSPFVNLDQQGEPILGPDNRPLEGVDTLRKRFDDQVRDAVLHRRGEQPVQPAEWNNLPALLEPGRFATLGIDDLRTLHGRLSDQIALVETAVTKQRDILTNLKDEAAYLADSRVNWEARLRTLERRQKQMEDRLRELGGR
jgi:hypothetical protein